MPISIVAKISSVIISVRAINISSIFLINTSQSLSVMFSFVDMIEFTISSLLVSSIMFIISFSSEVEHEDRAFLFDLENRTITEINSLVSPSETQAIIPTIFNFFCNVNRLWEDKEVVVERLTTLILWQEGLHQQVMNKHWPYQLKTRVQSKKGGVSKLDISVFSLFTY